jgi:hypothetical protein
MAKWEYKVVEQSRDYRGNVLTGFTLEDFPSDEEMITLLDTYGSKGWELVSVVPIVDYFKNFDQSAATRLRYFFKRETY